MEFETKRLILRPWKESDAEALFKYASDPDVGPRAGWPPHKNIEESRSVIRDIFTNDRTWAITLRETGEAISYALPTMEGPDNLRKAVERFTNFARENAGLQFFVTPVGCGIAGYTPEDVAPLFEEAASLDNVNLPVSFWKVLLNR